VFEASFEVSNVNGSDDKEYTLNLHVTADYPVKGGSATREADAEISVTIQDEPNDNPDAPAPFDIIVGGDNVGTYVLADDDDNDYDSDLSLWVVPHDGGYEYNDDGELVDEAHLHFTADASSDPEGDELSYQWETGLDHEPFTDLNGDGTWSVNEPYDDIDGDFEWDDGDVYYTGINLDVYRVAGDYTFHLIVTDIYGASSSSEIVVGVEGEHNEGPESFNDGHSDIYMPDDVDDVDISTEGLGTDSDNDVVTSVWTASDGVLSFNFDAVHTLVTTSLSLSVPRPSVLISTSSTSSGI
jgi:hypothetical protein